MNVRLIATSLVFGSVSLIGLGSCGGPSKDAKIAVAIQTLMANVIEAYAGKSNTGSSAITYNCSGGGTFSYDPAAAIPTNPLDLINSAGQAANVPVTFTQCVVKVCGDTITLNTTASEATLGLGRIDELVAQYTGSGQVPARLTLSGAGITATGLISGTMTFSYALEAVYTQTSLSSVEIKDADTPTPLTIDGKSYSAADIQSLSDGC